MAGVKEETADDQRSYGLIAYYVYNCNVHKHTRFQLTIDLSNLRSWQQDRDQFYRMSTEVFEMKKLAVYIVLLIAIYCCSCETTQFVLQDNCYFSDFSVTDESVYITCFLSINNSGEKTLVKITATSEEDVAVGLLSDPNLVGWDEDLTSDCFELEKGVNEIVIVFAGKYGGTEIKQDRNLPENINITVSE